MPALPHPFPAALGLDVPVVQGPMAGADSPALCAAVSGAGALGMLGCGMRSPAAMREAVAAVRAATARPFGINLFVQATPAPDAAQVAAARARLAPLYARFGLEPPRPTRWCEDFDAQFATLLELRPAVASFTFGLLDAARVAQLRAAGCTVLGTATTVAEALAWERAGADAVVASGAEAGGHRGTFLGDFDAALVGTLALVPQCVDALGIPVVAAGGVMDARGLRAALALGAVAAQMGTAFLACEESAIGPAYRRALAAAGETDTRVTPLYSGRPARGIANALLQALAADGAPPLPYPVQNALTAPLRKAAAEAGDAGYLSLWAGQGVALARARPAAELVRALQAGLG